MADNYSFLIEKLDKFIRKYYVNKLLKGVLFTTAIILVFFLSIVLAENQFYFTPFVRKILFFGFILSAVSSFIGFVLKPILQLNRLGNQISHKQAADIIGVHFNKVQDKLLNVLQLKENTLSLQDASLIEASIKQKSEELKPVPFTSAIDLQENSKYLKFVLPPLLLFIALLFFRPSLIKDSTNRLVQNNLAFEKPMPFYFEITNEDLRAIQFEDYKLNILIIGEELPQEVFIVK
ncbi:MAG: hypothetical protein ACI93P_002400, partial [bacterium]